MWLNIAFCCVCLLASQAASQNYTLYMSKYIRPGFDLSFTFSLLNGENPANIQAFLSSSDGAFSQQADAIVEVGSTTVVNLGKVPVGYSGSTNFMFNITAVDAVTEAVLFQNSTDDYVFASKALSIYIQTDKAIYQPGQTSRPTLRPYIGKVKYQVQDPDDNIVLLEDDVGLSHGVASGEFSLNKDATEGDWTIAFFVAGYKEVLPVTVRLYKLPKFEVIITSPPYIHAGSESLDVEISAKYTYGKPVKGSAVVVFTTNSYSSFSYYPIYGHRAPEISMRNNSFDGKWKISIKRSRIESTLEWRRKYDSTLYITANVTEELTSTEFTSTASVDLKSTNIKLENLYHLKTIKPGLTYTAYLRLTEHDGSALSEEDRRNNQLIVDLAYRYPAGHMFPEDTTPPPSYHTPERKETLLFDIPPNGIVELKLNAKNDEFSSLMFSPYTNSTSDRKYRHEWTAERAISPSSSYLQITTDDSNVAPGQNAQVMIRTTEAISFFNVMVIARGEILRNSTQTTENGVAATEHSYSFLVTDSMMPNVHVLASYVRQDGEIVADFLEITVAVQLQNQVTIRSSSTKVDAGNPVNITVETSANAYVGLRAIDKSVLLLKSGNDITQERVVQDLNRYSVSDDYRFDDGFGWWWWYPRPSGANDATDVFNKAGILVLTNAFLPSSPNDYYNYRAYFDIQLLNSQTSDDYFHNDYDAEHYAAVFRADSFEFTKTTRIKSRNYFPETWLWKNKITGYKQLDQSAWCWGSYSIVSSFFASHLHAYHT